MSEGEAAPVKVTEAGGMICVSVGLPGGTWQGMTIAPKTARALLAALKAREESKNEQ